LRAPAEQALEETGLRNACLGTRRFVHAVIVRRHDLPHQRRIGQHPDQVGVTDGMQFENHAHGRGSLGE